jgi:hypothetical protein
MLTHAQGIGKGGEITDYLEEMLQSVLVAVTDYEETEQRQSFEKEQNQEGYS